MLCSSSLEYEKGIEGLDSDHNVDEEIFQLAGNETHRYGTLTSSPRTLLLSLGGKTYGVLSHSEFLLVKRTASAQTSKTRKVCQNSAAHNYFRRDFPAKLSIDNGDSLCIRNLVVHLCSLAMPILWNLQRRRTQIVRACLVVLPLISWLGLQDWSMTQQSVTWSAKISLKEATNQFCILHMPSTMPRKSNLYRWGLYQPQLAIAGDTRSMMCIICMACLRARSQQRRWRAFWANAALFSQGEVSKQLLTVSIAWISQVSNPRAAGKAAGWAESHKLTLPGCNAIRSIPNANLKIDQLLKEKMIS